MASYDKPAMLWPSGMSKTLNTDAFLNDFDVPYSIQNPNTENLVPAFGAGGTGNDGPTYYPNGYGYGLSG